MLRHAITIEPYLGTTATGPTYGPAVVVSCWVAEGRRLVRTPSGDEIVSQAMVYADLGTVCPPDSRVTLESGRVATAIACTPYDGRGLPTPDHVEIDLT
jgi:hypothetical protein